MMNRRSFLIGLLSVVATMMLPSSLLKAASRYSSNVPREKDESPSRSYDKKCNREQSHEFVCPWCVYGLRGGAKPPPIRNRNRAPEARPETIVLDRASCRRATSLRISGSIRPMSFHTGWQSDNDLLPNQFLNGMRPIDRPGLRGGAKPLIFRNRNKDAELGVLDLDSYLANKLIKGWRRIDRPER